MIPKKKVEEISRYARSKNIMILINLNREIKIIIFNFRLFKIFFYQFRVKKSARSDSVKKKTLRRRSHFL